MVSVIIPTYNRSELLSNCIDSFLNQNFSGKYEIIVIDNNSSDDTFNLVNLKTKSDARVKYHLESRKGLVYARHKGATHANGEILIFVDDDGEYNSECIQRIVDVYELNQGVVAVGGKIDIRWDCIPENWVVEEEPVLGKLNYGNEIVFSDKIFINGGLFSIKKSVLIEVGGFNPDQVGEYLVGDGETGLCMKLHEKKYLIGWTPFAQMQHIQFVSKNGTLKDLGRRYYNNGICMSFAKAKKNNFKFTKDLLKYYLKLIGHVTKKELRNFGKPKSKKFYLNRHFIIGQFVFLKFFFDKEYIKTCKNNNWF